MTVSLCIDCRWCIVKNDRTPARLCVVHFTDPVTGTSTVDPDDCSIMRGKDGECGPAGTLWEAKT